MFFATTKKEQELKDALNALLDFQAKQPEPQGFTREHWTGLHRRAYLALGRPIPGYCAEPKEKGYAV